MLLAWHAREAPEQMAIRSAVGDRSFDELNARANQLVRSLRSRGLTSGDGVALLCANRPEFAEVYYAVLRSGMRVTPINWHLTAREMAYIIDNCEARAVVADARFAEVAAGAAEASSAARVRLCVGGEIPGFESYQKALSEQACGDIEDPSPGFPMLYTSGTTGNPKGVYRPGAAVRPGPGARLLAKLIGYRPGEDLNLCTGPLYHAAPLAFSLAGPLAAGVGVVLMDGWDPERALALIEEHRITHTHMVPTMFHRMLSLPEELRSRFDLSSLRMMLHGAAPCPVHVKQQMMDWVGPIIYEYYAATEGWGSLVTPELWLSRPGTVGMPLDGAVKILGEQGEPLPAGAVGRVYMLAPEQDRFSYFKDEAKTQRAFDEAGTHFTLGDMGYLDDDGYLFLADRRADVIISGGVNIYPAEVDAVLLTHPAVADAATIGIPDDDWGESVRSVVELRDGSPAGPALERELVDFCRERLAHYKCPRGIDFSDALPRYDTGKIYRRLLRDRYWQGRERKI
jgi:long-chain acyl-CoA synthetase